MRTLRLLTLSTLFALAACRAEKPAEPVQQAAPARTSAAEAKAPAPPARTVTARRTIEQAMDALMALPELKAWSAYIEKESKGDSHGALMHDGPGPVPIKGKQYWQFTFVENGRDASHRWQTFLVAQTGDEILVNDFATDTILTLEQWRRDKRPLEAMTSQ